MRGPIVSRPAGDLSPPLVKKDPHHRRGSFFVPRRGSLHQRPVLDRDDLFCGLSSLVKDVRTGLFEPPSHQDHQGFGQRNQISLGVVGFGRSYLQPQRGETLIAWVGAKRRPRIPRPESHHPEPQRGGTSATRCRAVREPVPTGFSAVGALRRRAHHTSGAPPTARTPLCRRYVSISIQPQNCVLNQISFLRFQD